MHKTKSVLQKKIHANNKDKSGLHIDSFELRHDMYEAVLESLQKAENEALSQSAIIYRTNQELRSMAYKLRQKGIPYISKEDCKSMFDEAWYLDVEAYIRLGLGSLEREYILRVANKPNRFIKREQLVNITRLPQPLEVAVKHIRTMRPYLAIKYIWSGIGYGRWLERELGMDTEQWDVICEQLEEITREMKRFSSLEAWLEHVEEDRLRQKAMSKGLEFDTVYLLDVNKGKVPKGAKLSAEELEEERRLFYVAMTRARKYLNIYYVRGTQDHVLQPSMFLEPMLG